MPFNSKKMKSTNKEQGFTLIELSIVLVIIGLIVGGVLVGQDLIKAAEVRATISQIEKYNTAVRTFQGKFGGIPGDLANATAVSFGLLTDASATGGDGNGLLESTSGSHSYLAGEPLLFWNELTNAGLIDGAYGTSPAITHATFAGGQANTTNLTTTALINEFVPPAKLGRGNSVIVGAGANGFNYYIIGGIGSVTVNTGVYAAGTNNLTPIEANNIDKKTDDGMPVSGNIQATDIKGTVVDQVAIASATTGLPTAPTNAASSTSGDCTIGTGISTDTYNLIASTGATTQSCSLRIKFQ